MPTVTVNGSETVVEFGNSLNDRIEFVRTQFEKAFPMLYQPDGRSEYFYVTDVFDNHVVVRGNDRYYEVKFKESNDSLTFAERNKWKAVKLNYVQEMLTGHFTDHMIISEFRGDYPTIPVFDDVDVQELTGGEKTPVFVTLPIGMANVTSGNKRHYDEKFLTEMEKQVREKKPIGLMGHLSKEERATAFPAEAVHWVGAQRVNEILWGKGFVPSGEPRNRLQRYKATKKKIATSIDASADGVWNNNLDAYVMLAETLNLAQIDIAPADRAGISNLAAVPLLTQEMAEESARSFPSVEIPGKGNNMGKEDENTILKPEDIPEDVKKAFIQEMAEEVGLPQGADPKEILREYLKMKDDQHVADIKGHVTEMATAEEGGIKVDAVRELVVDRVMSRTPKTKDEAKTMYEEEIQNPRIVELLEKFVQETMGPSQTTPSQPQSTPAKKGKYFIRPEIPA